MQKTSNSLLSSLFLPSKVFRELHSKDGSATIVDSQSARVI